jgi:signal transduction histidine kinase/CheY-like chemotaxis protein
MAKIMVVDDHPLNRQFLVTLLAYGGHRLIEASDGLQALALVQAEHPDLVITDILMPSMDGVEFSQRLKADPVTADTPVIFYTATYRLPEARSLAERCGVFQVLGKPSDPDVILNAVSKALGASALKSPVHMPNLPELYGAGLRLSALIELELQATSERDPDRLLTLVCYGLRDLLHAKYAALGIVDADGKQLRKVVTAGLSPSAAEALRARPPASGIFARLLDGHGSCRWHAEPGDDSSTLELPGEHPAISSFLGLALVSQGRHFGWMYLADKLGSGTFDAEDERIGLSLAAKVAVCYQNLAMYEDLQKEKARLEMEIARRVSAEEEARKLNLELENRVRHRTEELEAANRELEAFCYSISHDLRSPLQAIDGFSRVLMAVPGLPAESLRYAERIRKGAETMNRMVDDLLNFSRLGRQPLQKVMVSPKAIVDHALEALQTDAQKHRAQVSVGRLPDCYADPSLLERVYVNLLSNAFKFTRRTEAAKVQVDSQTTGDQTVYFVRDNGEGFDMQYATKLFGVFQRLHSGKEFEGTGVGLAIVHRIIERHGGRIWAEAAPGKGATFYFTLPSA